MVHILVGIIAIVIGLWGIARSWYMFKDMLVAIIPLAAVCFGIVALLAGIRSIRVKWTTAGEEGPQDDRDTES